MSFSVMEKQLWASLSFQLGGGCTRRDNLAHSIFRSLGGGASRVSYQSTQLYLWGHCDVLWCVSDGRCSEKRVWIMWNLPAEGFQTGLHVTPSSNSVIPPNLSLLNCELRIKEFLAHAPKGWTLCHKHAKCQPFHFALLWTIKVYHLQTWIRCFETPRRLFTLFNGLIERNLFV